MFSFVIPHLVSIGDECLFSIATHFLADLIKLLQACGSGFCRGQAVLLLCHVQNIVAITKIEFDSEQNKTS